MFRRSREDALPSGPRGRRAYVIGDIHGRLDLLQNLLNAIHSEIDGQHPGNVLLVFLGDLIDRGPNSKDVLDLLRTYSRLGVQTVVEGVETPRQLDHLRDLGAPLAQGFHLGQVLPLAQHVRGGVGARP